MNVFVECFDRRGGGGKWDRISAWNLAVSVFPVFLSPIVWNMSENLHYEKVYFEELHNDQEYY